MADCTKVPSPEASATLMQPDNDKILYYSSYAFNTKKVVRDRNAPLLFYLPIDNSHLRRIELAMGKAKTQKRGGAASSPYDRPSKQGSAAINNVFKFNTKDYGQRKLSPSSPNVRRSLDRRSRRSLFSLT